MGEGAFDTGAQYLWKPLGIFHAGQSVTAGPANIAVMDNLPYYVYRVDYASLVLRFLNAADDYASCEMSLVTSPGVYTAFLSCSAGVNAVPPGFGLGLHATAQLSLPFYVVGLTGVWIRGDYGAVGSSNFDATISISRAVIL